MFLIFFCLKKVEKTTSKSCLLKQKFCRFRNFSFTAQMAEFMFQNVAYRATVYRTRIQYTHKKLTVAYVDCVTWFNIWGARIGSTFQGNLEEWCIKFLFSLCTTCKRRRKKNVMSGLLNCCFMTGFKSIKLFTGTDNDMPDVPKLKVSKSWK